MDTASRPLIQIDDLVWWATMLADARRSSLAENDASAA